MSTFQIDIKKMERRDTFERCQQEQKIHKSLQHPNIVDLYQVFRDDRYIYLVLELCKPGDFQRYVDKRNEKKKGPLEEGEGI